MDLLKARLSRTHKYIKRTGTPGNYKYWYKAPDGSLKTSDDIGAHSDHGKKEHVARLLHARRAGKNELTNAQIAELTGHKASGREVGNKVKNMDRRIASGEQNHEFDEHHLRESHHSDVHGAEYVEKIKAEIRRRAEATPGDAPRAETPAPTSTVEVASDDSREARISRQLDSIKKKKTKKKVTKKKASKKKASKKVSSRSEGPDGPSEETSRDVEARDRGPGFSREKRQRLLAQARELVEGNHVRVGRETQEALDGGFLQDEPLLAIVRQGEAEGTPDSRAAAAADVARDAEQESLEVDPDDKESQIRELRAQLDALGDWSPGGDESPAAVADSTKRAKLAAAPESSVISSEQLEEEQARQEAVGRPAESARARDRREMQEVRDQAEAQGGARQGPEETPAAVRASENKVRALISTEGSAALDLGAQQPDFAASEEHVRAVETSTAENPYLDQAKAIYDRIKGDLKPDRKTNVKNFLLAVQDVQGSGDPLTEANILQVYKAIPGNERKRTLPKDDIERGTFYTMGEIINNPPVDIEVERMKRGYAAKQYARMEPFLKDSWKSANPGGYPPMPTFGDLKSWGEHGGEKPSWAGRTRIAVPEDVFNAAHKIDGKPKYPPAWMPINLMPVWNYMAAKIGDDAYAARGPNISQGRVEAGNQAQYQEGAVISALRKYVQMRGGVNQLVDIPSSKLAEVGLTHSKIFKSEKELSDEEIFSLIKTKIFDPVALVAIIKDGAKLKKSFSLVVKSDLTYIPGETLKKSLVVSKTATFTPNENLKKARDAENGFVIDIAKAERIEKIRSELKRRGLGA